MGDIIVTIILVIIVSAAIHYIWKEKKKGNKCIGCSAAGNCSGCCNSSNKKMTSDSQKYDDIHTK